MARSESSNGASRKSIRNIHIEVPEPFHRRLKVLCALKGVSLKTYAQTAIEEQVKRDDAEIAANKEGR
jgi:predicted HicB family RNase H-like nuclease